jgi:signal transduction histidine kinase
VRRRLILSTALIALAAVVVLGVPLGAVEAARLRSDTTGRLEREADGAAGAIDDLLERHRPVSPALLRRFAHPSHRIAVTTRDGRRITTGPPLHGPVLVVRSGSASGATVVAQEPMAELDDRVHREWLLIALLALGGVLIAAALAALQARRLARPLEAVARRSAQLGEGDFSVRMGHFGVPEIDAVAQSLDTSAARIAELVAREREFSANVSHQLRTPLTALRLRIEEAGLQSGSDGRRAVLDAALVEADRLEATIGALLAHARQASGPTGPVDLGAVAREHAATWRPVFARAGRALEVEVGGGGAVARSSRATVGQILDVLLDNALHHGAGPTHVRIGGDERSACVWVGDAGPGIPAADRERIFERGASRLEGTGIGLHLARTLAQGDGGSLRVADGSRTGFELRLPPAD